MSFFTVYELVINLDHNIPSSEGESVLKFTKDNLHHPEMENVKKKLQVGKDLFLRGKQLTTQN